MISLYYNFKNKLLIVCHCKESRGGRDMAESNADPMRADGHSKDR